MDVKGFRRLVLNVVCSGLKWSLRLALWGTLEEVGWYGGEGGGGRGEGRPFGDEMFSRSRDLWRQEML